ncbi:MAG: sigma-70 family RNA polymerase sigma factor [Candidatus Bipolaricaulia bacterium]
MKERSSRFAERSTEELLEELAARMPRGENNSEETGALKEEIIQRNVGLVAQIAREFVHSGEPLEDLVQAGYIGLLNAVHNFDLKRGNKFSTYATHLIKGEIRHYIRDKHGPVKIPQWIQELNSEVNAAEERLFKKYGRFPTIKELAEELNMAEEGVREVLKARKSMSYVSIDRERRADDPRPTIDIAKIKSLREEPFPWEQRVRIMAAVERLTVLQQRIIHGLFYGGKSQKEVGKEIGLSQRQVSRLKGEILQELRGLLGPEEEPPV